MESSDKNTNNAANDEMLPPPSRQSSRIDSATFSPISSITRKPSLSRAIIPTNVSASAKIGNSNLYDLQGPMRSTRYSHHRSSSRFVDSSQGQPKDRRLFEDMCEDAGISAVEEHSTRGKRTKPLFGHRERKYQRQEVKNAADSMEKYAPGKQIEENPQTSRRFSVGSHHSSSKSPKSNRKLSNYDKVWTPTGKLYEDQSNALLSKSNSPLFTFTEGKNLDNWFGDQKIINRGSDLMNPEEPGDEIHSLPYYDHLEDTERTIFDGSSPSPAPASDHPAKELERNIPDLTDLDESLKLVPDPQDYRPGAYNELTHEEWLLAGQNLIGRFTENSQKVQKILLDRAERMEKYTVTLNKYHELLRQRQTELHDERKSIQDAVRQSISGYWKPRN